MMRMLRASVIATLSLLAWATTASSECAWLMWLNVLYGSGKPGWTMQPEAYKDRATCLKRGLEGFTLRPLTDAERDTGSVEVQGTTTPYFYRYHCLPDTVDPRGPKGK